MQRGAEREGRVGIDGVISFVDETNDALLIDDDVCAESPLVIFVFDAISFQDAVGREHLVVHVAEQRKMQAVLLREGGVGGGAIEADAKHFGVRGGDAAGVDAGLDGAHLLGTTFGESEHVNRQEDIFLSAVVTELDGFPLVGEQREIGRALADAEGHVSYLIFAHLMRDRRGGYRSNQHETDD